MPTIDDILSAAGRIATRLFLAVADGHVSPSEAADLHALALAELRGLADDVSLAEVVEWVGDLLDRDPAKMRERAERLEARGKVERAAHLRERAVRVEARQVGG